MRACVRALLDAGASTNSTDKNRLTPLILASRKGSMKLVRALLQAGADMEAACARGWTPLY
ncbi:ankyrin repeat domain-containing protein, partial [archaeon]